MLAFDCFETASSPIAPIYRLHLSLTFSSLMSNSFIFVFWSFTFLVSYVTSIYSKFSSFSTFTYFFYFFYFLGLLSFTRSFADGSGNLFNSVSSSLIAFYNIVLY